MANVYMDSDPIYDIVYRLDRSAQALRLIDQVLLQSLELLRVVAFIGLVSNSALEHYLATIQPQIRQMIERCEEMSSDLKKAAQQFLDGEEEGSSRYL